MKKTMSSRVAQRIRELPPYLFARIDELKNEARAKGADIIDLGIGDPDLPTPAHIVAELARAAQDARHHRYPSYQGMRELRAAAADYAAPADACVSYLTLYEALEGFEKDLHQHIHLENNVLFPRAIGLEKSSRQQAVGGRP